VIQDRQRLDTAQFGQASVHALGDGPNMLDEPCRTFAVNGRSHRKIVAAQNFIDVCEPSIMHQRESTRASDAVMRMCIGGVRCGARTCRARVTNNGSASLVP